MGIGKGTGPGGARPGAGRPKGSKHKISHVSKHAQRYGRKAIQELWDIAQSSDSDIARVQALREILDRGFGKSTQDHSHGGRDGGAIPFTFDMGSNEAPQE